MHKGANTHLDSKRVVGAVANHRHVRDVIAKKNIGVGDSVGHRKLYDESIRVAQRTPRRELELDVVFKHRRLLRAALCLIALNGLDKVSQNDA
jgi:hypothetical protein